MILCSAPYTAWVGGTTQAYHGLPGHHQSTPHRPGQHHRLLAFSALEHALLWRTCLLRGLLCYKMLKSQWTNALHVPGPSHAILIVG